MLKTICVTVVIKLSHFLHSRFSCDIFHIIPVVLCRQSAQLILLSYVIPNAANHKILCRPVSRVCFFSVNISLAVVCTVCQILIFLSKITVVLNTN